MPTFIVKTTEAVEGTYRVEAENEADARSCFGDPGHNWERIEQIDYSAFSCEIKEVESTE